MIVRVARARVASAQPAELGTEEQWPRWTQHRIRRADVVAAARGARIGMIDSTAGAESEAGMRTHVDLCPTALAAQRFAERREVLADAAASQTSQTFAGEELAPQ